jgi:hypothetical protein
MIFQSLQENYYQYVFYFKNSELSFMELSRESFHLFVIYHLFFVNYYW